MVIDLCFVNKRYIIPKGQSKKENPEKLATWGTQYEEKHNTTCAEYHHTQANTKRDHHDTNQQRGNHLYTVPLNTHFIAVWTKLDTFYFLIFHSKIRGNSLIRGKLPSLVKLLSWLRASSRGSLGLSKVWSLISFQHLYVPGFDSSYSPLTSKYADSVSKVKGCLSKTVYKWFPLC
jgi:hypothetical protein